MEDKREDQLSGIIRLGGYLVLIGVVVGAGVGVYAVVNPLFFSRFVGISQYEVLGFFTSVSLPSFVVIVALGYIFATTLNLDDDNFWRAPFLSILSFICIVLSALSVFNFVSFAGSFLVLFGAVYAFTRPTFKASSAREASFFVEIGSLFVASFSTLFLLMRLVAAFLPSYAPGVLGSDSSTFLILTSISFFMFFATLFLGLHGAHTGVVGALDLILIIVVAAVGLGSRYIYLNSSGYFGAFMLIIGIILVLFGALINFKLFFSTAPSVALEPIFSFQGKYCPYCGTKTAGQFQTFCARCGRKLAWRQGAPFCPYCGRVVPTGARVCPHCQETLE